MIVVDASAALSALFNDGPARRAIATDQLHVPYLIDSEVANGLRRAAALGRVDPKAARNVLETWRRLGLHRYSTHPFLGRIWQLRDNLTAYDAGYVALAESLKCHLVTADTKLSHAPGIRCAVPVMPR